MNEYVNYDKNSLIEVLENYHLQIAHAIEIGDDLKLSNKYQNINKILVLGMGGSAIGGDLLRSFLNLYSASEGFIIQVNRNYNVPNWLDSNTLVIASSYSGNTEETVSALLEAKEITNNVICITSGGEISSIAKENNYEVLSIPNGFQPRCALAYSAIILLKFLHKSSIIKNDNFDSLINDLKLLPEFIQNKSQIYGSHEKSEAFMIAQLMKDKVPVIFSTDSILGPINLRWRGQLHENSKVNAFGSFLPEMNHNEINSFKNPSTIQKDFFFIFLSDESDHPKINIRINAMIEILELSNNYIIIKSEESNPLLRMFDLLYLIDWISLHLAEFYEEDAIAIPLIMKLKSILG